MAIKIKNKNEKIVKKTIFVKILYIAEKQIAIKHCHFFMNSSG